MDEIRVIDLETRNAFENMAIDEAIMMTAREKKAPPTFRLYRWLPSAVSIGTFQGMHVEVDVDYCRDHGIDVIRRITGGGAVYHDYEGEITYSIIVPKDHRLAPRDILKSYELVCQGVVSGLMKLGIESEFAPINDILTGGRKISGNAQTRRHECLLQHGTVLIRLDVATMFSVLKVHPEKISDKVVTDVKQRVTSITDVLGRVMDFDDVKQALCEGFAEALSLEMVPGKLTAGEKRTASSLIREKYSTDAWNFLR